DIALARSLDADGIVIGALTPEGDVDVRTVHKLVEAAGSMQVTFHRAFDFVRDQNVALETLIELGVDRVLTSGGAPTALEGAQKIASLVELAGDDIAILAGGSITADNVAEVVRLSRAPEVHVRAASRIESAMAHRSAQVSLARPVPSDYERVVTQAAEIERVIAQLPRQQ